MASSDPEYDDFSDSDNDSDLIQSEKNWDAPELFETSHDQESLQSLSSIMTEEEDNIAQLTDIDEDQDVSNINIITESIISISSDDSNETICEIEENIQHNIIQLEKHPELPDILPGTSQAIDGQTDIKTINGVRVEFPVKPYKSQVALMSSVIRGIQKNQNCLLESPTGTGKTLALLCAALAWQKQEATLSSLSSDTVIPLWSSQLDLQTSHPNISSTPKKNDSSPHTCSQENTDNPAKKIKISFVSGQSSATTPIKVNQSCSSPTGSPQKSPSKYAPKPKIYFCSRTHKQLQQAIKELKRTTYSTDVKVSTLSSRKKTCIESLNTIYKSKDDMCQKMVNKKRNQKSGCTFFDNVSKTISACSSPLLNGVWDIEDLVKIGKEHGGCPFYISRKLAEFAEIIFCPYIYIISPSIRSALNIQVNNNIIIIDEAHNVEDCCRESASITFSFQDIIDCKNDVERLKDKKDHHEYFLVYFGKWFDWFRNHHNVAGDAQEGSLTMDGNDFFQSLQRHDLGPNHRKSLAENISSVHENINKLSQSDHKSKTNIYLLEIVDKTLSFLKNVSLIFDIFYSSYSDYSATIVKKPKTTYRNDGWLNTKKREPILTFELVLSLNCLNPALIFKPISENARCVILASGTLSPMAGFSSELGVDFPIVMALKHNISSSQLWIGSVSYGPGNIQLESTFAKTKSLEWQDSLGNLVSWICDLVPFGVLCFLPSYSLLNILFKRWYQNGVMNKIKNSKNIFSESSDMDEHNQVMADYYDCCNVEKGAILFAVYRGKISEGMDFKDDQARAVITVGIPYPNIKDPVVKSKMDFNNRNQKERGLLPGGEWLRIQAFRALNQALGRCIRHSEDWGAVILVDSRFIQPSNLQSISNWAQQFMKSYHSWEGFSNSDQNLVHFINNKY